MIFGLTGDALDENVRSFLEAGADCVLGKVLSPYPMKGNTSNFFFFFYELAISLQIGFPFFIIPL